MYAKVRQKTHVSNNIQHNKYIVHLLINLLIKHKMQAERMEPSHKENGHGIAQQNKAMTLIPLICCSFCRYKYVNH